MLRLLAVTLLITCATVQAADWAVLVAGSNSYGNYRHQADICHAYHVVSSNGIPDSRIIMLYYDDIANNGQNPFKGQIFNKPATTGVDIYKGCKKDYTGNDVTAKNFLNIITGNAAAMKGIGSGKVLQSGPNDNVFINFSDHGGTGLICFPVGDYLYTADLSNAMTTMYKQNMFKKLVFYLEACESGSMFENVLPTNQRMYATTAANAEESSWGCYCPPDDVVNGKELNSCLGDLYSVNWMENADSVGPAETLEAQFELVRNITTESHVMQYGDLSFTSDPIGNFMGDKTGVMSVFTRGDAPSGPLNNPFFDRASAPESKIITEAQKKAPGVVGSRDIPMHLAYYRYLRADAKSTPAMGDRHALAQELIAEITSRVDADKFFCDLAHSLTNSEEMAHSALMQSSPTPVNSGECVQTAISMYNTECAGFNDYSLQYTRTIVNLCNMHENTSVSLVADTIRSKCQA
jgi:legumain